MEWKLFEMSRARKSSLSFAVASISSFSFLRSFVGRPKKISCCSTCLPIGSVQARRWCAVNRISRTYMYKRSLALHGIRRAIDLSLDLRDGGRTAKFNDISATSESRLITPHKQTLSNLSYVRFHLFRIAKGVTNFSTFTNLTVLKAKLCKKKILNYSFHLFFKYYSHAVYTKYINLN